MDKLDYKILNILKENGRETASDISKAIHLSVSAVLDRIKKMEESGIIKGYTVRVDAKALGNDVTALMEISLEHPRFHDSFTEVIMDHRSEERRVGKECSEPCRSRWSPYH